MIHGLQVHYVSWTTFEAQKTNTLFTAIDKYFDKQGSFTKSRYLKMCKQLEKEPKISEMPIELSDFPYIVRISLDIFNRLGDRYVSTDIGPIYIGKDLSTLEVFYRLFEVDSKYDQVLAMQIVQHLDSKAVTKSMEQAKRKSKELAKKNR